MYYYGARWYDATLGRFTHPDQIIPEAAQGTQAWDRYAYVNNNPIRYNDPTGQCIGPLAIVCAVSVFVGAVLVASVLLPGDSRIYPIPPDSDPILQVLIGLSLFYGGGGFPIIGELLSDKIDFLNFTSWNFRENLMRATSKTPQESKGLQAYHMLPQKFEEEFNEIGININDPSYGAWVDRSHQSWTYAYNKAWSDFFSYYEEQGLTPTAADVIRKAIELAKRFNINWTPPNISSLDRIIKRK